MARRQKYAVVVIKRGLGKRAAEALAVSLGGGDVLPVADHDEHCPNGSDHAHARYDGATFCSACGQYLSIRISKSEGRF